MSGKWKEFSDPFFRLVSKPSCNFYWPLQLVITNEAPVVMRMPLFPDPPPRETPWVVGIIPR